MQTKGIDTVHVRKERKNIRSPIQTLFFLYYSKNQIWFRTSWNTWKKKWYSGPSEQTGQILSGWRSKTCLYSSLPLQILRLSDVSGSITFLRPQIAGKRPKCWDPNLEWREVSPKLCCTSPLVRDAAKVNITLKIWILGWTFKIKYNLTIAQ